MATATIRNKQTGAMMTVNVQDLPKYGLSVPSQVAKPQTTPTQGKVNVAPQTADQRQPIQLENWRDIAKKNMNPLAYKAAQAQEYLGESEALPTTLSTLFGTAGLLAGGPGGSAAGSGVGAGAGEWLKQGMSKNQGLKGLVPNAQETGKIGTAASTSAALDFFLPKVFKVGGKVLSKVASPITKPVGEFVKKQVTAQMLRPAQKAIEKSIVTKADDVANIGRNELFDQIEQRGLIGKTPKELLQEAVTKKTDLWNNKISSFISRKDLPNVSGEYIEKYVKSLDSEIADKMRLWASTGDSGDLKNLKTLLQIRSDIPYTMKFKDFYEMIKVFSKEARAALTAGKDVIDINADKTRMYDILANNGRKIITELTEKSGFPEYAKYMSDYHFYADLEPIAKSAVSKGYSAIGSIRDIMLRAAPTIGSGISKAKKSAGKAIEKVPKSKLTAEMIKRFFTQGLKQEAINQDEVKKEEYPY